MTGHTGLKGQAGPSAWGSALTKAKEHALEYLQCCHTMAILIRNTNLSRKGIRIYSPCNDSVR